MDAPAGDSALAGGARRFAELVTLLVADSAVQQRIAGDAELRSLWNEPAVRTHALNLPATATGMLKTLELLRELLADPAVQARIEADSVLRALWSDSALRELLRGG